MSGMITKPPPYDERADLERHPGQRQQPAAAATAARAARQGADRRAEPRPLPRAASSTPPQPSSTSTSHGPTVAAASAAQQRRNAASAGAAARALPARPARGSTPAWTATAATAAPAPAPAPRTQSGGEPPGTAPQGQDQDQPGHDEAQRRRPARRRGPRTPPRAVDRQLRRGRAGQQVARGDRVLELVRVSQPRRSTHSSRSSAMCAGGPPKPMQPIRPHSRSDRCAAPARGCQGHRRLRAPAGWKSSIGLPEGSSSRICWPPGPLTMSLRNVRPAARSRSTSAAMSSTMKWMRFQPPGLRACGRRASAGRPSCGPLSSSRRLPRTTSANAGAASCAR